IAVMPNLAMIFILAGKYWHVTFFRHIHPLTHRASLEEPIGHQAPERQHDQQRQAHYFERVVVEGHPSHRFTVWSGSERHPPAKALSPHYLAGFFLRRWESAPRSIRRVHI